MDYQIEEFDPFIFVIKLDSGISLRIFARWYDGSERSKAMLGNAIASRAKSESFAKWLTEFNLELYGPAAYTAQHFPNLEVIDPPEVKALKTWLATDGVKGDWESNRSGCKLWKLPFDEVHEDVYALLGSLDLTLLPEEYLREYLLNEFGVLPSDLISLARLKDLLNRQHQIELDACQYEANEDFTKVVFCDKSGDQHKFEFDVKQAVIVRTLANSDDVLGELDSDLLSMIESDGVLRNQFKGHPAWGTFIVQASRKPLRRKLDASRQNPA